MPLQKAKNTLILSFIQKNYFLRKNVLFLVTYLPFFNDKLTIFKDFRKNPTILTKVQKILFSKRKMLFFLLFFAFLNDKIKKIGFFAPISSWQNRPSWQHQNHHDNTKKSHDSITLLTDFNLNFFLHNSHFDPPHGFLTPVLQHNLVACNPPKKSAKKQ